MNRLLLQKVIAALLMISMLVICTPSSAQVQAKLQAAIFIKLLNYDSALAEKKQSTITFHIVLDSKTNKNLAELKAAFGVISKQKVANKNVLVAITNITSLSAATTDSTAHVYYLPDGSSRSTLEAVLSLATEKKIAVLGGNADLAQSGAAVGINVNAGKPEIIVNLKQCKLMGMNLSSQLLKLAKVI